jgi:hypothetical protein
MKTRSELNNLGSHCLKCPLGCGPVSRLSSIPTPPLPILAASYEPGMYFFKLVKFLHSHILTGQVLPHILPQSVLANFPNLHHQINCGYSVLKYHNEILIGVAHIY